MSIIGKVVNEQCCPSPSPITLEIQGTFPSIGGGSIYAPLRRPEDGRKLTQEEFDAMIQASKQVQKPVVVKKQAHTFLEEASTTMRQRAELRDAEGGERTAAQIAKVFNAITGNDLSEADAWMFLVVLKIVRSRNGKFNADDYVDLAAYAGLLGECESQKR